MDFPEDSQRAIADGRLMQQGLIEIFGLPQPVSDAECLDEVRRICEMTRLAIDDPFCHTLVRQIERYANIFFLADENAVCWGWHTPSGYDRLHHLLLRCVNALGLRLAYLEVRNQSHETNRKTTSNLRALEQELFRR